MQAEIRWALTARPKSVSLWLPLAPSSGYSLPSGSIHRSGNNRDAADTSGPGRPIRLNGHGWAASCRLQGLATGRYTRRCPGLQSQVPEDLLDHRLFQDRRDDLQLAAAVRAVLQVDLESAASAKTNLYSSYVAANTRLSSLAQLSRTGR